MKVFVKVKPRSKEVRVNPPPLRLLPNSESDSEKEYYTVLVKEPPTQGKANTALVNVLAEYFKVSKSDVRIVSGLSSKTKVIEINV